MANQSNNVEISEEQKNNIVQLGMKLYGLGIDAVYDGVETGPVVTGYFFKLKPNVSIKKIMNKAEDFALAMGVDKITIQRISDRIVLFVPNKQRSNVDFKDALYWYLNDPEVEKQELPILLGVDYHGRKSSIDLTEMPHMLIAGETGSGKSVFEAGIISSLSYYKRPDELHFYLVDTKRVDLPLFSTLPHVKEVIETLEQFHARIDTIITEIRNRLAQLAGAGCRKIQDYHALGYAMPYIIVLIDEFGDLMDLDSVARRNGEYEDTPPVKQRVKQIAQIARAAGVHLILCTQRSSVKVVDGDTKTNLPCRIALRLPTDADSRTILGTGGAQNLLGKGDMLVQRPGKDIVERYHGPFVSMNDIAELVTGYNMIKDTLKKKRT